MAVPALYRRPPRGRPRIGFQLEAPREIELREGPVLRCREVQRDGKTIGELEVSVFAASLVIDRDGILAEKARSELQREAQQDAAAVAVQLPGGSGFRAEAIQRTALPYLYVFTVVPQDGIEGGLLIKVRSARPDWPAADHMLQSLRILTRDGIAAANDDAPLLPLIGS